MPRLFWKLFLALWLSIMRVEARQMRSSDTVRLLAEVDGRYSLLSAHSREYMSKSLGTEDRLP